MKFLLALLLLIPAQHALSEPKAADLLTKICEPGFVKGTECTKVKNYPSSDASQSCAITLGKVYEAHLLSTSSTLVVADYDSPCEPHVTNWGGGAYFKKQGKDYTFVGFQPGVRYSECLIVPDAGRRDRMVCTTAYMGQGYIESTVSEVRFSQDYSGKVSAHYDVLTHSTSNAGALGAESIDCSTTEFPYLISLALPAQKPSGNRVKLEVDYADKNLAERACRKPYTQKQIEAWEGRPGMAALPEVRKGLFWLNLETRELKPTL